MTDATTTPILTDERVDVLNAARDVLHAIAAEAQRAAWDAPTMVTGNNMMEAFAQSYGAVQALAEHAEDAIFNMMNRATSTRVSVITDAQLHHWATEDEDEGDGREPDGQRMEGGRWIPTDW